MMSRRGKRLLMVSTLIVCLAGAAGLVLQAFRSNLVFFYTPSQVAAGEAPKNRAFRIGGLVKDGSLQRNSLDVRFVVSDTAREMAVTYRGILPDLFREGRGVVAQGHLTPQGEFVASEVLAKHDENYMPPEARQAVAMAGAPRRGTP